MLNPLSNRKAMKHSVLLRIALLSTLLTPSCNKNSPQDNLPEHYLLASEMHAISVLVLNPHYRIPTYVINFELSSEAADRIEAQHLYSLPERPEITIIGDSDNVVIPMIYPIESLYFFPYSFMPLGRPQDDSPYQVQIMCDADALAPLLEILNMDEESFRNLPVKDPGSPFFI